MYASQRAFGHFQRVLRSSRVVRSAQLSTFPTGIGTNKYQEGDCVYTTRRESNRWKGKFIPTLKAGGITPVGSFNLEIRHDDIIGRPSGRLYVDAINPHSSTSSPVRVEYPSFDQFVSLAPRSVTPIYSSYSATIVDLLDIHVSPPQSSNEPSPQNPPVEILESGTGHGSLTIHLSKAIAAANPPPPSSEESADDETLEQKWSNWRASRRAVIHTVEYEAGRSKAAEKAIRSIRAGLYWPHVDFHAGDVTEWICLQQDSRQQASMPTRFLDIVCLDMPDVHRHLSTAVMAMKDYSKLLVYVPSIAQLGACQYEIENLNLSLKQETVLELGEGISNGRQWDLRFVKPRKDMTKPPTPERAETVNAGTLPGEEGSGQTDKLAEFPTMVCRPLVGEMTRGGAFIGLWRRIPDRNVPTS